MKKRYSVITKIIAICLILALAVPTLASAAEPDGAMPYASHYLSAYSAYVYVTSTGEVQVWFDVMGTGDMDEIGALSVRFYESTDGTNWTWVKTLQQDTTSGMLFYNDDYVSSHVSIQGSTEKQYKANVCVWAGKDGDGDSRYFWAYQPKVENN